MNKQLNSKEEHSKLRYESNIFRNGAKLNRETFVDWYQNDAEALSDAKLAMEEQGYAVDHVEVNGKILSIHLANPKGQPCAS